MDRRKRRGRLASVVAWPAWYPHLAGPMRQKRKKTSGFYGFPAPSCHITIIAKEEVFSFSQSFFVFTVNPQERAVTVITVC
jgi:hypothetical protein